MSAENMSSAWMRGNIYIRSVLIETIDISIFKEQNALEKNPERFFFLDRYITNRACKPMFAGMVDDISIININKYERI